jgi:hypothetical protein
VRAVLIDTSGSLPVSEISRIRSELKVGDKVICFDCRPHVIGTMKSQDHINYFQFIGGGGSLLCPALRIVKDFKGPIAVYTDGYVHDMFEVRQLIIDNGLNVSLLQVGDDRNFHTIKEQMLP